MMAVLARANGCLCTRILLLITPARAPQVAILDVAITRVAAAQAVVARDTLRRGGMGRRNKADVASERLITVFLQLAAAAASMMRAGIDAGNGTPASTRTAEMGLLAQNVANFAVRTRTRAGEAAKVSIKARARGAGAEHLSSPPRNPKPAAKSAEPGMGSKRTRARRERRRRAVTMGVEGDPVTMDVAATPAFAPVTPPKPAGGDCPQLHPKSQKQSAPPVKLTFKLTPPGVRLARLCTKPRRNV